MIQLNTELLQDLIKEVHAKNLKVLNVNVRQQGDIIAKHNFVEEKPSQLWSVSKTFTSMAIGIAIKEGHLTLDDYVVDYFKDLEDIEISEQHKKITIHHMLSMSTGHDECPFAKVDWNNLANLDLTQLFFQEPILHEPGTHFTYNNASSYILSRIIQLTTGQNLLDYLDERIFQPLDIPKPQWYTCPNGVPLGFAGLLLTAEHLSRFGQLLLDQGLWKGQQLIPSDYIQLATSVQTDTSHLKEDYNSDDQRQGYGYQLWMNTYPNSYRLDGAFGQFVVILPDKNAVVTYISNEPDHVSNILQLTWNTLIDKL